MENEQYYIMPKILAKADGYISQSREKPELAGQHIPITLSGKLIYMYMLDRTRFFVETQKGQHFESQETIANALSLERKVVGRVLNELVLHGIIEAKKLKPNGVGQWRWFYNKVNTKIVLWRKVDGKVEIIESLPIPKDNQKPKQAGVKPYQHVEPDFDESELPF